MRNLVSATMILGAAALASPATAAEPECTPATARAVTPDDIIAQRVDGQCVTVGGIAWRRSLYPDVAAIYAERRGGPVKRIALSTRRPDPKAPIEVSPDMTVGEFALQSEQWTGFEAVPRRVTVTGKTGRCRGGAMRGGEPDQLIGYRSFSGCSSSGGGMSLVGVATEVAAFPVTRLTPADAAPDLIGLSPLAPESVWTPRFAAAADAVFAALASGKPERWKPLFGGPWLASADHQRIAALLNDKKAPFRAVLRSERPSRAIFGWHFYGPPSAADRLASEAQENAEALVCWSDRADAARLWPIAAFDADNAPGRPYACVRITYSMGNGKPSWRAYVEEPGSGLPEPKR